MGRYYRRRRSGSGGGIGGLFILAFIMYVYGKTYSYLLKYVVLAGLLILVLIVCIKLWKHQRAQQSSTKITYTTLDTDQDMDDMTPLAFEKYVAARLAEKGYTNVQLTEYYDWGVDIIAHKDGVIWGVQVKHCSNLVKVAAVRQVVTALKKYNCDRAMVVTNGCYSRQAIELAKSNNCLLVKV